MEQRQRFLEIVVGEVVLPGREWISSNCYTKLPNFKQIYINITFL